MATETPAGGRGALGVALVAIVAYQMWPDNSAALPLPASSNRRAPAGKASAAAREELDPAELKVKLEALEAKRPDFDAGERNPFGFQPPPAPPPPKLPVQDPVVPVGPPQAPPPPSIPPITLKFMGTVERPGLLLAALTDCKGFSYAAREGEIVDGRYRLVKVGLESVILEYSHGTGRTTVRKSGDCPK